MTDSELRAHLTARHPGIHVATGPTGMYPAGRPAADLAYAHTTQHEQYPDAQDHTHGEA